MNPATLARLLMGVFWTIMVFMACAEHPIPPPTPPQPTAADFAEHAVKEPKKFCEMLPDKIVGGQLKDVCWKLNCPEHTLTLGWKCEP